MRICKAPTSGILFPHWFETHDDFQEKNMRIDKVYCFVEAWKGKRVAKHLQQTVVPRSHVLICVGNGVVAACIISAFSLYCFMSCQSFQ